MPFFYKVFVKSAHLPLAVFHGRVCLLISPDLLSQQILSFLTRTRKHQSLN